MSRSPKEIEMREPTRTSSWYQNPPQPLSLPNVPIHLWLLKISEMRTRFERDIKAETAR